MDAVLNLYFYYVSTMDLNCLCFFQDFSAKNSSFKIPKKLSCSPGDKDKKGSSWIISSFDEEEQNRSCLTRDSYNQKQRINANYSGKRKSEEIEYCVVRQGLCVPRTRRWKHADPPGSPSARWNTKETEPSLSHGLLSRKFLFYRTWSQLFWVLFLSSSRLLL